MILSRMHLKNLNLKKRVQSHELPTRGRCPECGTFGACTRSVEREGFRQQYRKCPSCGENFQTAIMLNGHNPHSGNEVS